MKEIIWKEENRLVSELKPYDKNPRYLNKDKFDKLVKNIQELGYTNRIIINVDNTIAGGHVRLKALEHLKIEEIPVLVPNRYLTEDEMKRAIITDNISFGNWDMDELANNWDLEELESWGLDNLCISPETEEFSSYEESVEETKVKDSDIWILGNNTLVVLNKIKTPELLEKLISEEGNIFAVKKEDCSSLIKSWEKLTGLKAELKE